MNNHQLALNIFTTIVIILVLATIWQLRQPGLKEYNKYMCANYGYYEDCKTPLPPELRLK